MRIWQAIQAYASHDDPLVAAGNIIALVVASNQPFYPLYLLWTVGTIGSSPLTFLSTVAFALVPALAHHRPILGRALLPLAGIANTALAAKLFGVASGVELFLIPSALIAAILFRPGERLVGLSVCLAAFLVYVGMHGRYGPPFDTFSSEDYERLLKLNAISAGCLSVFVGLTIANAFAKIERGNR